MVNIGLLDYDVLSTKRYIFPNYDIGVTYAYYKNDKNISIRLISSLSYDNLSQYDKIYVFKQSKDLDHPVSIIKNYYQLPIEEYGEGFLEKPLRPFLKETRNILPDCSCYNKMIMFSLEHPNHKLAWHISKESKGGKYEPIRLYEKLDDEDLKRDYPTSKTILVYDDPVEILNNKKKWDYYNELLDKKIRMTFVHRLDISRLLDTNIIEQVLSDKKYGSIRRHLIVTELNEKIDWLIKYTLNQKNSLYLKISVLIPPTYTPRHCFLTMLLLNYYNHKTNFIIFMTPTMDSNILKKDKLALLAFNYLNSKPYYMSFYEYVFNVAYIRIGVPKVLIHTGEAHYDYIGQKYGAAPLLEQLENFMYAYPDFKEYVLIGGSSFYEEFRRKYYDTGGSRITFT